MKIDWEHIWGFFFHDFFQDINAMKRNCLISVQLLILVCGFHRKVKRKILNNFFNENHTSQKLVYIIYVTFQLVSN